MSKVFFDIISIERAIAYLLLADHDSFRNHFPLMRREMFAEAKTWAVINEANILIAAERYSQLDLLAGLEKGCGESFREHFAFLASAVTANSGLEKHWKTWLPTAKIRFLKAREAVLEGRLANGEIDFTTYVGEKIAAADEAQSLGSQNVGISIEAAAVSLVDIIDKVMSTKGEDIVSTCFPELDDAIVGYMPGTLNVLCARPNVGKTSYGVQVALNAVKKGMVLFNTLEMTPEQICALFAAQLARVNSRLFYAPHKAGKGHLTAVVAALSKAAELNICFTSVRNPIELDPIIAKLKPVIVIDDYLQRRTAPVGEPRNTFLWRVCVQYKDISKKYAIPSLVLAQLNRNAGDSGGRAADAKDSGGIEEEADSLLVLERPSPNADSGEKFRRLLRVEKARFGVVGAQADLLLNPLSGQWLSPWNEADALYAYNRIHPQ